MEVEIDPPVPTTTIKDAADVVHDQVAVQNEVNNGSLEDHKTAMSCDGDEDDNAVDEDDDDPLDLDEDDYNYSDDDGYFYGEDDDDDYSTMQAQFDNVDLPPGVEASVSWMPKGVANSEVPASSSAVPAHLKCTDEANASSSSPCVESSSGVKEKVVEALEVVAKRYEGFKNFDVVEDPSDHHYANSGFQGRQPPRSWSKKVQDEWRILENDLPGTIYVRVYESRMDLLRAVIVGPQGTPYHDGLFVFDVLFPTNYPDVPPMVYYYSGGLRLNPNLYDCGKVCLSLLNTWSGKGCEKWAPNKSTMLQVLVSIQALILNAEPYYNEPGYESQSGTQEGKKRAKQYSEDAFVLSLKTMMYTLRRPPKHFEELVSGHFRVCGHNILSACQLYTGGVTVGTLANGKIPDGTVEERNGSPGFKQTVGKMINGLVSNFTRYGVPDCEQFRMT